MLPTLSKSKGLSSKASSGFPGKTKSDTMTASPLALQAPILGKYGSFYSYKIKKQIVQKPKKSFGKTEEPLLLHLPPLVYPPKHDGFYNIMWDPHVRRGSSLVRFSDLEKKVCDIKSKRKNNTQSQSTSSTSSTSTTDTPQDRKEAKQFSTGGGSNSKMTSPQVQPPHKTERLDYSAFLEEQIDEDEPSQFVETETQTESSDNITGSDGDSFVTHNSDSNPNNTSSPMTRTSPNVSTTAPTGQIKNTWKSGVEAGTQGNQFEITAETEPLKPNPRQKTIDRISKIMASQLMFQSAQETMQGAELDHIRGQCEEITQWLAKDDLRKYEEHKRLCKVLNQERLQEEFEAAEEAKMKEAEAKVGGKLFAQNYVRTLFERGFVDFQKDGIVSGDYNVVDQPSETNITTDTTDADKSTNDASKSSKAGATKTWLNTNVEIYSKNWKLDRSLLDDLIINVSTQRYADHEAFFDRPDISSSLKVEGTGTGDSKELSDTEMPEEEKLEPPKDNDDTGDDKDLNEVVNIDDDAKDKDNNDKPEVIQLMDNNPQFRYKDNEQD